MLIGTTYFVIFVLVGVVIFSLYYSVSFQEQVRARECSTPQPEPYIKGRIINSDTRLPIEDAEVTIRRVRTREPSCESNYIMETVAIRTNDLGEFITGYTAESWMKFEFVITAEGCVTKVDYNVSGAAFFEGPIIPDGRPDFFLDCAI